MKSSRMWAVAAVTAVTLLPALAGGAQKQPHGGIAVATGTVVEAGVPAAQDSAAGRAIFTGKGICQACHGPDAKGTPLAPNLTDTEWLHIDGSMDAIVELINKGVPTPKNAPAPMPAKGGAALSDEEVRNVAAYVYSISRPKG